MAPNSSKAYSSLSCPQKILLLTIKVGVPKTSFSKASEVSLINLSLVDFSLIDLKNSSLSIFTLLNNLEIFSIFDKSWSSFQ